MPDVPTLLGAVGSLVTAAGALAARLAANRREIRVRNSIETSLKFVKELKELGIDETQQLIGKVSDTIENDLDALSRIVESRNREKYRNYASLLMAIFLASILTLPLWFLWRPSSFGGWILFIGIAILAALVVISGLFACFKEPETKT